MYVASLPLQMEKKRNGNTSQQRAKRISGSLSFSFPSPMTAAGANTVHGSSADEDPRNEEPERLGMLRVSAAQEPAHVLLPEELRPEVRLAPMDHHAPGQRDQRHRQQRQPGQPQEFSGPPLPEHERHDRRAQEGEGEKPLRQERAADGDAIERRNSALRGRFGRLPRKVEKDRRHGEEHRQRHVQH